jgi:hypothetical protein
MSDVAISAMQSSTIEDFELPSEYSKLLRRADDFTKSAVSSTYLALNSAPKLDISPEKTGLFWGTSFGPLETSFRFLDTLLDDGEGQASPTLFSHSVHNAAAGYLSRIFTINGPAITLSSYTWPFLDALNQAFLTICSGVIDRAIVVTSEMCSPLMEHAGQQFAGTEYNYCETGAVTWILDKITNKKLENNIMINHIEILSKSCDVTLLLTRVGEEWFFNDEKTYKTTGLLSYAFSLTSDIKKILLNSKKDTFNWSINAPFGHADLKLSIS